MKCDIEVSHWVWQVINAMNLFDEILNWDSLMQHMNIAIYLSSAVESAISV